MVKESTGLIAGTSKENRQLMLKRPELPNGFQRRVFKDSVRREGGRMCDQLVHNSLVDDEVMVIFSESQLSVFWL